MNLKILITGSLILISSLIAFSQSKKQNTDMNVVKNVDINRYIGKWYEIARFNHTFERDLVGVTAEYTLLPNGKIQVLNSGYKNNLSGKYKTAKGKAKIPNAAEPGKLKVAFFLWFYADYYILELDERNYSYALIGSNSDKYLWILSRTPQLPQNTIDMLLEKASKRGYDVSKLIWVKQHLQ